MGTLSQFGSAHTAGLAPVTKGGSRSCPGFRGILRGRGQDMTIRPDEYGSSVGRPTNTSDSGANSWH